jgi:hypothetical protein
MLEDQRHLIPLAFPGLYRAAISQVGPLSEPSFSELKGAFATLVRPDVSSNHICIVIDGIDEYEGAQADICHMLLRASESPTIKIVALDPPYSCLCRFLLIVLK